MIIHVDHSKVNRFNPLFLFELVFKCYPFLPINLDEFRVNPGKCYPKLFLAERNIIPDDEDTALCLVALVGPCALPPKSA